MIRGDRVKVSVRVEVPRERAFVLFTEHIDRWWRRGYRFRASGQDRGVLHLEPHVGGRLFESWEHDGQTRVVATGTVERWEPPALLELTWRNVNFREHEATTVVVTFVDQGSSTMVTVEHTGWASLPPDHPARHGLDARGFVSMMGRWWADLLTGLREHAASR